MTSALKLRAADAEDLAVVSSVLQDALVPVGDMEYFAGEKRFVMVANRFRWEAADADGGAECRQGTIFERVNCAVTFEQVDGVRRQNIDRADAAKPLSILTVQPSEEGNGIDLVFSGKGLIRLAAAAIDCRLEDMDEPWPTRHRPDHEAGTGA